MFPGRYFPNRYFAGRFWPKIGAEPEVSLETVSFTLYVERARTVSAMRVDQGRSVDRYIDRSRNFNLER